MKKTTADINLSIDCSCPYCDNLFDLLDCNEMTDDGLLYKKAMNDKKGWGCADFNEEVMCPECHNEFIVEQINY